jgi:BNR repeat-like domain/RTX calcium-binding nonapeptide repeat (4 copies)
VRRLLPVVAALVLTAPAVAATIHGTAHGDSIVGTPAADTIVAGAGNDLIQAAFGGIDTVNCGAGRDIVSADATDRIAANCEVVSRRLSRDTSTNPSSQHETAVEPDSFSWGTTVVAAYQLGRYDDGGAASNIGVSVSSNAGLTWTQTVLPSLTVESQPPGPESRASDPTVAYDAVHGVWLVGTLTLEGTTSSHVYVAHSTDGLHWSVPVNAASGPELDKDWLACDNNAASPYRGRCYAEFTDDAQGITVSESSDDGGVTWSAPVRAASILVGTQPVILPNGTLIVVAGDYTDEDGLNGAIDALRSTDGGATFTRVTISPLHAASNQQMRAASLPSVDVDSAGTIYAVWDDCRFRAACKANDMMISTSTDGIAWTTATRIPLAPPTTTGDYIIPGLAADPTRPGHLGLVYGFLTPGSCARGACTLEMGFTTSPDGGKTWTAPQRLDAQPMRMTWLAKAEGGRMVGDYFSTSFASGRVVPVFALATSPLNGRYREGIFAASLPAG